MNQTFVMVKIAVIGVGNMGFHHARNYKQLPKVKLVGISDINSHRGKEVADLLKTTYYSSYLEMVKKEKPDAVSIAVPTEYHFPVAIEVMPYVKNILLEKPIASSTEEAKKILKQAKKHNVRLSVGYVERFNPVISALKKTIQNKTLGDVLSITVKRVGLFPPHLGKTDVISDLATHDIDILAYLLEKKPKLIAAMGGKYLHSLYDYAELMLQYGKTDCFIQTNWITPVKIRRISVTGTKGYLEANLLTQEIVMYKSTVSKNFSDFKDFLAKFGTPKRLEIKMKREEPLRLELKAFVDSINKPTSKNVSSYDAFDALKIAEHAIKYLDKKT